MVDKHVLKLISHIYLIRQYFSDPKSCGMFSKKQGKNKNKCKMPIYIEHQICNLYHRSSLTLRQGIRLSTKVFPLTLDANYKLWIVLPVLVRNLSHM